MELDPAKYGKRYLDALAVANRQRYYDEATDMCRTKLRNGGSPAFAVFLANVYRIGKGAMENPEEESKWMENAVEWRPDESLRGRVGTLLGSGTKADATEAMKLVSDMYDY